MPYPDKYGRHPWIPSPSVDPADPWFFSDWEQRRSRENVQWAARRGEPPRFWDEEYYIDNPGPWPLPDELGDDTARGYRFFLTHPLSETRQSRLINAMKGRIGL